jgi:dihydroorotate dehydrogenase (fumarate)
MNLSTNYMGFELSHPIIPGASPLTEDLDMVRRLEDAGAPMIIMYSLFEEQVLMEPIATRRSIETHGESFAEALSYFPDPDNFDFGPDEYLEQVRRVKAAVGVPVVGSLNGVTPGGWVGYAQLIQQAGADGLEINLYEVAADLDEPGASVERRLAEVVASVREAVALPVAVKLSPFFSSPANFLSKIDALGIEGLVLFNRFYQPDLDVEHLSVKRYVHLSNPSELLLRLRWIALVYGRIGAPLAVTGGVHSGLDAVKSVMAGASACQMVSALLQRGPEHLSVVVQELSRWLEEHEYESLRQMLGCLSLQRVPNPSAYERANYAKILHTWQDQSR